MAGELAAEREEAAGGAVGVAPEHLVALAWIDELAGRDHIRYQHQHGERLR
jgi:hypothetical protein